MSVIVFSNNLVVLVNDCLTKKLRTKEVEEMWSSNSVFVSLCDRRSEWFVYQGHGSRSFSCFRVLSLDLSVYNIQFVDDTIILDDALIDNL